MYTITVYKNITHKDAPQSVELARTSDQLFAETTYIYVQ
jgi:hypothetical protein